MDERSTQLDQLKQRVYKIIGKKENNIKNCIITCCLSIIFIFCIICIFTFSVKGRRESIAAISEYHSLLSKEKQVTGLNKNRVLKILTLNIAHGRKDGVSQILQSRETIKRNLDDIVSLLQRISPDIVALQEADGPSVWSGGFSHIAYIAEKSGYYYSVRGAHVEGMMLSYGTALLSRYPLAGSASVTFKPSPPTFSKGFVSADINMINKSKTKIVSVHLDFFRRSIREEQVQDMVDMLVADKKSLIIMGDFNCELEDGSVLQALTEKLNLAAYQVGSQNMITFPALGKRLDYILISKDFEFITYRVIKDIVSDHLGVISEIRKKI